VRSFRGRTKKLIVAFHFLRSNPAGWKCDTCRRSGWEIKRRCGWVAAARQTPPHIVWARGPIETDECPTSLITAQSIGWIEEYYVWKRLNPVVQLELDARQVQAFLILEEQLELEKQNGAE